ncbi:MAG: IS481 family transposase [Coriobacteriaceae bacterium]|nr:IS481 family transposase [Coriobacteriaceae bacterium]
MSHDEGVPMRTRWARLRFAIIGPLLAAPTERGELAARITELAQRSWQHPTTGETTRFGVSSIERWYYLARDAADPLTALARKVPSHAGTHPRISARLAVAVAEQHAQHPRWSFQLHYDNLVALARQDPTLGCVPSYTTLCRYLKDRGLTRSRRRARAEAARVEREAREVRSFEVTHVQALWHLDFHEGSRKVLTAAGEWQKPQLLGILDDHSRLCCHLQWYLDETAETLIHGLSQALQKRGLPRQLLTDNGAAMVAAETTEGLERLGIVARNTLPYSPEQNAKQEVFWAQVEGRLMAMLEGEPELTLTLLNQATQAWVELEYHRRPHREIDEPPLERYLRGPSVSRPCPDSETLRRAFRTEVTRAQRRSDGTCTVEGVRFEIPARYRTLRRITLRVARWDLSAVDLVDGRTGSHLARLLPLDKTANADSRRRRLPDAAQPAAAPLAPAGIAAHLRALMAEYAATGLPPAYLPKEPPADPEENPT